MGEVKQQGGAKVEINLFMAAMAKIFHETLSTS